MGEGRERGERGGERERERERENIEREYIYIERDEREGRVIDIDISS